MTVLQGIRVVEMAGLAPVPFCGMLLSDFGAEVIRVDRTTRGFLPASPDDPLARGKRSIRVDLKHPLGVAAVARLIERADVLLDSFRPGVLERLGLGPEPLMQRNPRLIYARLTGYGQTGPWSHKAGHDINYLSLSGALSQCGRQGQLPSPPANIVADFAGGGLFCAFGVLLAIIERLRSGKGQVIDSSMVEGTASLTTALHYLRGMGVWNDQRGTNLFDTGAPWYDVYEAADGGLMSVGALEPQFFASLLAVLEIDPDSIGPQMDPSSWPEMRRVFAERFRTRTRNEWLTAFESVDACVTPVLGLGEVQEHPQARERESFVARSDGTVVPAPAPRLGRTPASPASTGPREGEHTREVLRECGYDDAAVDEMIGAGAVGE